MTEEEFNMMIPVFWEICTPNSEQRNVFTDMKDGTIRYQKVSVYLENHCGKFGELFHPNTQDTVHSTFYIKKCLQGQVYRSAENDCRGTGSSPEWGAVKYQFCPTNDRSCDMTAKDDNGRDIYVADPTKSPAAKACADDTTAGKSWYLPMGNVILIDNFLRYSSEIITGTSNLYWINRAYYNDKSSTWYIDSSDGSRKYLSNTYINKNEYAYVLCTSIRGNEK